jgi:hypothetical protein
MSKKINLSKKIDLFNDDMGDIIITDNKNTADSELKVDLKDIIKADGKKSTINAQHVLDIINNSIKELKTAKSYVTKMVKMYQNEIKKLNNIKNKKHEKRKDTGVMKASIVPKKISDYLGLEEGSKMIRNQVVSKFYQKIKEKDLFLERDKRVFRVDAELMKIFDLNESVNNSTNAKDKENGFNFYNLPTHIAKIYREEKQIEQNKKAKIEKKRRKKKKPKIKNKNKKTKNH